MGTRNLETQIKIALCGKIRSGKDSVAFRLRSKEKFTAFAFSEGIKETGHLLFPKQFGRKEKPRKLLQQIGQYLRQIDPNVWVNFTFERMEEVGANRIVVTDLRQPNEYEALKADGFFIVRIETDPELRLERARAAGDNFEMQDLLHETEMHVDKFKVDYTIYNDGDLDDLERATDEMFKQAVFKAKGLQYYNPKGDAGGEK